MDRREEILERLAVVMAAIPGVTLAGRNIMQPDATQRPCVIVLDADEQAGAQSQTRDRVRPSGPVLIDLTPEIYLLVNGGSATVGPAINAFRVLIVKAVLTDATLATLVTSSGAITYEGCATGLSRARSMEGEMGLQFTFTYPLNPSEL